MNFVRLSLGISFLLLLVLTLSCAKVAVKNTEWCGDMGEFGAACFNTQNKDERSMNKAEWDTERFGMLCTTPESFAHWKAVILKLCDEEKRCTYEEKKALNKFLARVEKFQKKVRK